jgi:hypothetical protein
MALLSIFRGVSVAAFSGAVLLGSFAVSAQQTYTPPGEPPADWGPVSMMMEEID